MAPKRLLLKLWRQLLRKGANRAIIPLPSPLDRMPVELWHLVAEHLPPSTAAALALSCRAMLHILGTQYWKRLDKALCKASPYLLAERFTFLYYLDEQLPKHELCFRCPQYHLRPRPHQVRRVDWKLSGKMHLAECKKATFRDIYSHTRAVRLGSKYGKYLPSIDDRVNYEGWHMRQEWRMHGNNLMLHMASWRNIEPGLASSELSLHPKLAIPHLTIPRCLHVIKSLTVMINIHIRKFAAGGEPPLHLMCRTCLTEYRVDVVISKHTAQTITKTLVIEKWCELGEGRMPNDYRWTRQQARTHHWPSNLLKIEPSLSISQARRMFNDCSVMTGPPRFTALIPLIRTTSNRFTSFTIPAHHKAMAISMSQVSPEVKAAQQAMLREHVLAYTSQQCSLRE